jgi:hypothetical protein
MPGEGEERLTKPTSTSPVAVAPDAADPDRSELADLVAPLWTAEHTRRVLGLSRSAMSQRLKTGSVLAVMSAEGDIFYPASQFETRQGTVRVMPALRKFIMVFRDLDRWTIAVLTHTPATELDGLTPLDWVREGRDVKALVDYAGGLAAEYGR